MSRQPTQKERLAMDETGYSAMPLVTMFVLAPIGVVAGAVIGAFTASSVVVGLLAGSALGVVGGFATGIGIGAIGVAKCRWARRQYEKRVEREEKQALSGIGGHSPSQKNGFFLKGRLSALFKKSSRTKKDDHQATHNRQGPRPPRGPSR